MVRVTWVHHDEAIHRDVPPALHEEHVVRRGVGIDLELDRLVAAGLVALATLPALPRIAAARARVGLGRGRRRRGGVGAAARSLLGRADALRELRSTTAVDTRLLADVPIVAKTRVERTVRAVVIVEIRQVDRLASADGHAVLQTALLTHSHPVVAVDVFAQPESSSCAETVLTVRGVGRLRHTLAAEAEDHRENEQNGKRDLAHISFSYRWLSTCTSAHSCAE